MTKVRAHEIRSQSNADLLKQLDELKSELAQLRVAKVTGSGAASKLAKIKVVRKNIARVLTVYNQKQKQEARDAFKGKKYIPRDLRPKLTRAKRRELTEDQKNMLTARRKKVAQNFPKRK